MTDIIAGLKPREVWRNFALLARIPHGSGNEAGLRESIENMAANLNLPCEKDQAGNLVVRKPGAPGLENARTVVLQSHLDMVCEKDSGVQHDFSKDPLALKIIDNKWVAAEGTTLGADNGIGVALMMAVMESESINHGPLELLFTVEEESGLVGARLLTSDLLKGRVLLNLDSEEEGSFYIGCAGSLNTSLILPLEREPAEDLNGCASVFIEGLKGGHSGMDINLGRANAIKLAARFISRIAGLFDARIVDLTGGASFNAIPREAKAILRFRGERLKTIQQEAADFLQQIRTEHGPADPGLNIVVDDSISDSKNVLTKNSQDTILNLVSAAPHGAIAMSPHIPDLVQTSTNLAAVRIEQDKFILDTKQRGSVDSQMEALGASVAAVGALAGAKIETGGEYPAWQPDLESGLLEISREVYEKEFSKKPEVKALHAGLECGLFKQKYPDMDMLSMGPNIYDVHSPAEKVEIDSVASFWKFLSALLPELARKA